MSQIILQSLELIVNYDRPTPPICSDRCCCKIKGGLDTL